MTTFAQNTVRAARACLATPFHHQGRARGVGLDCIGLAVIALGQAGLKIRDCVDYERTPDGHSLIDAIASHGGICVNDVACGDILVFRYDHRPQHVAIATSADTMIHSFAPAGKVIETSIGNYWRRRLVACYRFSSGQG